MAGIDGRKQYYLTADSETGQEGNVLDFGCVITDKSGKVYNYMGVLVNGFYGVEELFHGGAKDSIFSMKKLDMRKANYESMLREGTRTMASVGAINRWLSLAKEIYNPRLTAYNLAFDMSHCLKTGINLDLFDSNFCLWQESARVFASRRSYVNFAIANKLFTPKLNMITSAEAMAHYLDSLGVNYSGEARPEPHTALEDAMDFEVGILTELLRQKKGIKSIGYSWRNYEMRKLVEAKK
jgi:hypothetical protein